MEVPCKVCFDAHGLEKEETFFGFCGFTVFVCLHLFVFLFVWIYLFFVCLNLFVFLFVCLSFVRRAWALSHTMPS